MALDDGPLRRPGSAPRWWRTPVLPLLRKLTGQSRRGRRHVLGPVTEEVAVTATSPAGSGTLLAPLTRPAPRAARLQGPPVRVRMRCQAKAEKQLHGKTNADHVHLIFVKSITNDLLIFKKEK